MANVFNVELCRLRLTALLTVTVREADEEEVENLASVVAEESALVSQSSPEVLQGLLQELPSRIMTKVCPTCSMMTKCSSKFDVVP